MRSVRLADTNLALRPPPVALGASLRDGFYFQLAQRDGQRWLILFNAGSREATLTLSARNQVSGAVSRCLEPGALDQMELPEFAARPGQLTQLALGEEPSWGLARLGDDVPGVRPSSGSLVLLGGLNGGQPPGSGIALEIPADAVAQASSGVALRPGVQRALLWGFPDALRVTASVAIGSLPLVALSVDALVQVPSLVAREATLRVPGVTRSSLGAFEARLVFGQEQQLTLPIGLPILGLSARSEPHQTKRV